MKFNITPVADHDLSVPEPPAISATLKLINYRTPAIGWDDEENEPIYGEVTPEEAEKMEHFHAYRILLMRHTMPESERSSLGDGLKQLAVVSPWFDSRDPEAGEKAKREALGMAVQCCMETD